MKKKIQQKILILFISLILIFTIIYEMGPKEIKFEDVSFKDILENRTEEYVPYEAHFSIINPTFKKVNCIISFSLLKTGQTEETKFDIGNIPQRTKLKYKIPFNMPIGNTTITFDKNCTLI